MEPDAVGAGDQVLAERVESMAVVEEGKTEGLPDSDGVLVGLCVSVKAALAETLRCGVAEARPVSEKKGLRGLGQGVEVREAVAQGEAERMTHEVTLREREAVAHTVRVGQGVPALEGVGEDKGDAETSDELEENSVPVCVRVGERVLQELPDRESVPDVVSVAVPQALALAVELEKTERLPVTD
jgi:hypothetical protein